MDRDRSDPLMPDRSHEKQEELDRKVKKTSSIAQDDLTEFAKDVMYENKQFSDEILAVPPTVGPTGEQGPRGVDGHDGKNGADGPVGLQGTRGKRGIPGGPGAPGDAVSCHRIPGLLIGFLTFCSSRARWDRLALLARSACRAESGDRSADKDRLVNQGRQERQTPGIPVHTSALERKPRR
jgi:hypothetical protein